MGGLVNASESSCVTLLGQDLFVAVAGVENAPPVIRKPVSEKLRFEARVLGYTSVTSSKSASSHECSSRLVSLSSVERSLYRRNDTVFGGDIK